VRVAISLLASLPSAGANATSRCRIVEKRESQSF
jgi:hypothetical protein